MGQVRQARVDRPREDLELRGAKILVVKCKVMDRIKCKEVNNSKIWVVSLREAHRRREIFKFT